MARNGKELSLKNEFKTLRAALRSLDRTLQKVVAGSEVFATQPLSRRRLSPKSRASLVLQGRYMGYMRQLKPRQKAQMRMIKNARGMRAAIANGKRLVEAARS